MGHDGTGNGWDVTLPDGATDLVSAGDDELRDLRKGVALRENKEHAPAASGVVDDVTTGGGEHLSGSARAYDQTAAPTNRPDATTALGASDTGRLWVDDSNVLTYWNGSAWTEVETFSGQIETGDIAADAIDKTLIAADVAGDGLTQAAGGELDVNVDDSTIEVATDVVQLKDAGVTAEKLEADAKTLHAVVWDSKSTGTDGGASVASTWTKRDLNQSTVQHETTGQATGGGWCSVASDQITLSAGSYFIDISCPTYDCRLSQVLLYDTTGSADLLVGQAVDANATNICVPSRLTGIFTVSVQSVLEIRHWTSVSKAASGFGIASDSGKAEVYTTAHIVRLGDG